ncbi:hypothetical protein [Mucilaginibacter flavus]|uniref:hypothetical protein n=1 Tax=Mucilaginibacter flavus TaxID=931504 RepID=UPI0025B5EA01|nr:hypothetical protein [Mucilaginibacter flavus]MDN3583663.1 hypothetical protein [Mucilaginibacter flavus]
MAQSNHLQYQAKLKRKTNGVKDRYIPPAKGSAQFKEFSLLMAQANVEFTFPKGFKEIPAANNEDFSFDYAMEIPGQEFEIWFQVKSLKQNWLSVERNHEQENPDSSYLKVGKALAITFTGEQDNFIRNIPSNVLARYRADAGKSYLLNLIDSPDTKHYKYALLITLQKNHTGTITAVCFTNEKDPEFFRNIDKASNCLKFKIH